MNNINYILQKANTRLGLASFIHFNFIVESGSIYLLIRVR